MCSGVQFHHGGKDYRILFANPEACLPVVMRSGLTELVPWGRRKQQAGILPLGGWARHDSIRAGRWDGTYPKPVKIKLTAFMEKDFHGRNCWYDMPDNRYLQGLLARDGHTLRVYIVTVEPSFEDAHERMPRLLMRLPAKSS